MVLPDYACNDMTSEFAKEIYERTRAYALSSKQRRKIVEATLSRLIEDPDVLTERDPDEIVFSILHQEARSILSRSFAVITVLQPPQKKRML